MRVENSFLPPTFVFSQASLQDYLDCRRRFQLRYIQRVAWPALESEPARDFERAMLAGAQFHRLIQQHLLGIPVERLTPLAQGEDLARWWGHFLGFAASPRGFVLAPGVRLSPEKSLSVPLGGFRLLAKYDLLVENPAGTVAIFDWKTSRKRPRRTHLLDRMQTRVYLFAAVKAGLAAPPAVEMRYWFAEDPQAPEVIAYSHEMYARDEAFLAALTGEIAALPPDAFHLTTHEERCTFCTYRSLCNRGVKAGDSSEAQEAEAEAAFEFDFDQIAEIEF